MDSDKSVVNGKLGPLNGGRISRRLPCRHFKCIRVIARGPKGVKN